MKNTKKPTYQLKRLLDAQGLNPNDWRIVKETADKYVIINSNGETKEVEK